ncbi:MAG: hypothetical protein H0V17_21280 [Deltaproteobacteria bacterium]|nr:hypothetical protein [Deltaproteobacteria bacterium]
MSKPSLFVLALAGCWSSSQSTVTEPAALDVAVELAAVTLGDDCGANPLLPPPVAAKRRNPNVMAAPAAAPLDADASYYRRHCDQTSMQLSLRATGGTGSTTVKIKKVELLDSHGNFLADLSARAPTRWDGASYTAWNQTVDAGQTLAASYSLSSPNWEQLTGGRWQAHTRSFQLRVTLTVGSKNHTVDKQSITPAMLEPAVPT